MLLANIILFVIIPYSNFYYIFSRHSDHQKAIWSISVSCYGILVFITTTLFIGSLTKIFNILIILDKIHFVSIISILAYQALFGILPNQNWEIKVCRVNFAIQCTVVNILFKMTLL
jgi:hypothetical protein